MSYEEPIPTITSTKEAFLSGTLWKSVTGSGAARVDLKRDDLCVPLHNSGEIDFLSGIDQPAFEALQGYLPHGTDLSLHSQAQLNERPRKTLLYRTPAETFAECVAAIS